MAQYFFDVTNGRRISDLVGRECNDDVGAIATAKFLATKIASERPDYGCQRHVIAMNEAGREIFQAPVRTERVSKLHQRIV